MKPLLTLVISSRFFLQLEPTHHSTALSTRYVRKAAIVKLLKRVAHPRKITIRVWIYSNSLPLGNTSLTRSRLSSK